MTPDVTKLIYLVVLIFVLKSKSCVFGYRPQEIILYSGSNYTGLQKSFYSNNFDLKSDSIGKIAKSHCVVRGLWRVNGTFKTKSGMQFIENIYGDEKNGRVCGSWDNPTQPVEYRGIMLLGSQDLDTSAINLHSKERFYGTEHLYFDGRVLRLPAPLNFSSFAFTGKHNWTIFKKTDLTGSSDCLVANIDHFGGSGVTFNFNRNMTIGSIWRGCGSLSLKRGENDDDDGSSGGKKDNGESQGRTDNGRGGGKGNGRKLSGGGIEIIFVIALLSQYFTFNEII